MATRMFCDRCGRGISKRAAYWHRYFHTALWIFNGQRKEEWELCHECSVELQRRLDAFIGELAYAKMRRTVAIEEVDVGEE